MKNKRLIKKRGSAKCETLFSGYVQSSSIEGWCASCMQHTIARAVNPTMIETAKTTI